MRDKVKQIILSKLREKDMCRIDLHLECCRELGFDDKPKFNRKGQRIRICKNMTDYTFDAPLNELKSAGCLKWRREGRRVFYELTEK